MKKGKYVVKITAVAVAVSLLTSCGEMESLINSNASTELQEVTQLSASTQEVQYSSKASYETVQDFAMSLLQENQQETNVVLSPVSAYIAMSMAGAGAEGTTADQFERVMGKQENMLALAVKMTKELEQEESQFITSLANSAWLDDEFIAEEEWLGKISGFQNVETFHVDVASQKAMNAMNQWIEEKTRGLISQFLTEPLDVKTRLVLYNTVYFNGEWQLKFMPEMTIEKDFYPTEDTSIQVSMMRQFQRNIMYLSDDNLEGVVLPYQNANTAFVAMRTKEGNIRTTLENMSYEELNQLINDAEYAYMNLELPKYEVSFDQILNASLIRMGLVNAFDMERADFTGLGKPAQTDANLYLSVVRQKAVVKVDEEGTEAAAVTEVAVAKATSVLAEEPIQVTFDEPFLYMIVDMHTKLPLFMGIMDNPMLE